MIVRASASIPARPRLARRGVSIRALVAILVITPMTAGAVVLVALSIITSRDVAEELARRIVDSASLSVQSEVGGYLRHAHHISDLYARRVEDGILPTTGLTAWERPMLDDLVTTPDVASICFGNEHGGATWLLRAHGRLEVGRVREGENDRAVEFEMLSDGSVLPAPLRIYTYDPRARPWYEAALGSSGATWTPIYFWFGERGVESETGAGFTRSVEAPDGTRGVLVIDVTLGALSAWLRTMSLARIGSIYIVDGDELLVAASDGPVNSEAGERLALRDSPSEGARAAMALLATINETDAISLRRIELASGPARMMISPLRPAPGIDWRIISILPEHAFMAEADETQQRAILLGAAAILASIVFGIVLAARLSSPLLALAGHVRRVAEGDFNSRLDLRAARELVDLSRELNAMAAGMRQRLELQQALDLAMQVQTSLLPAGPPATKRLDVAGRSRYCETTGGDYFDYVEMNGIPGERLLLAVGDVMGHGAAAALLMATARAALRVAATDGGGPATLMKRINDLLAADVRHGRFMTMILLTVDDASGELCWTSAGHDAPIVYDPLSNRFITLDGGDIPLGVMQDVTFREYASTAPGGLGALKPGMVLVVGTDGIWEARNNAGEMFGKERVQAAVRAAAGGSAEEIARSIDAAHAAFLGGRSVQDDVTFVIVKVREA